MRNPWINIKLNDYENHMKLESVNQLQVMNEIMWGQFNDYDISTVMVLGVAGGNGLNHIKTDKFNKVYGVDVNGEYLRECVSRFPQLKDVLVPIKADLQADICTLPKSDMIIANLLIEYIGYENFQRVIKHVNSRYISCVIQVNTDDGFVSDSPYLKVFDHLNDVHHQITEHELGLAVNTTGYKIIFKKEFALPNKKKLLRLDYEI